jgi:hypothetical protein
MRAENVTMGMLKCASLSANKTELTSLAEEFDITVSYLENISSILFTEDLGIAWCNEDNTILEYETAGDIGLLFPGAYHPALKLTGVTLPSGLTFGTYKLYLAYTIPELNAPVLIEGKDGYTPCLLVTVSSTNQVTISKPDEGTPHLILTDLSAVGNLYQNRFGQFTATISNDGNGKYDSNLIVQLGSQLIDKRVVILAGETKTIIFSGTITVEPGNYTLTAFDNADYPWLSTEQVNVQVTPTSTTTPDLTLLNAAFPDPNQVSKRNPQLSVSIKNGSEPFADDLIAFVFSASGGRSLTYFGYQTVEIGQNEEKNLVANSPIDLPAGNYWVGLYCNNVNNSNSNRWMPVGNLIPVTLIESFATWRGNTSSEWNVSSNWSPELFPTEETVVTIPKNVPRFPELTGNKADNKAFEIRFEAGAQLGRQDLLTYDKAFVQYDFSSDDSRGRWYMLSLPLQEAYPGDFTFGGYPSTWIRKFTPESDYAGWGVTILKSEEPVNAGDGFIVWLDNEDIDATVNKGLKLSNGILELPFFDNDSVPTNVHHTHDYDNESQQSTFYNWNDDDDTHQRIITQNYTVNRSESAYKLADASLTEPLIFGFDTDYQSNFTLVGNPFMASLNFEKLLTEAPENATKIKDNYQVWTVKENDVAAYVGYHTCGLFGIVTVDETEVEYIAPMQSFIVEKEQNYDSGDLEFNISMTEVNHTNLRSAASDADKLNIVAQNEVAAVQTFIAKREGGQDTFGNKDARKLLNGISNVPEIYTLKSDGNNRVAVGANIINNDNLLIPIGLTTSYSGKITLVFTGMDSYPAKIRLVDTEAKFEKDMTNLETFEYTFNYIPVISNGQAVANENRFFIRFQDLDSFEISAPINVYSEDGIIHAVSDISNLIRQVSIYNPQGILLQTNTINSAYYATHQKWIPGVYIVKVVSEKGTKNVKLIVK